MPAVASNQALLLLVLGSVAAAVLAGLGALPFSSESDKRPRLVGLADALAAGVMLGAGYLLMRSALAGSHLGAATGAALGVLYTTWAQRVSGAFRLPAAGDTETPVRDSTAVSRQTLHSGSEGVAIGAACALDLRLGSFVLAALALHNIAEGVALSSVLRRRGQSRWRSAALCVLAKSAQPLLAIAAFVLFSGPDRASAIVAFGLGFGAGALVYLVLTELLPESYRLTSHSAIATLVTVAAGAVLFLEDLLR